MLPVFWRSLWEVAVWPVGKSAEVDEYVIEDAHLSDLAGARARTFHAEGVHFHPRLLELCAH